MFAIVNVAYFALRRGLRAHPGHEGRDVGRVPVARIPEAKVYDPQGFYEKNGQPGPYFPGNWSGWMSGQPDGRPTNITPPADGGRCNPTNVPNGGGSG